jgi:hypothetical protein
VPPLPLASGHAHGTQQMLVTRVVASTVEAAGKVRV